MQNRRRSPSNHRGPHSVTRRDVAALVLAAAAVAGCFGVVRSLATQLRGEQAVAMVVIGPGYLVGSFSAKFSNVT